MVISKAPLPPANECFVSILALLFWTIYIPFPTVSRALKLLDSPCLSKVVRWIRTKDTNTGHRGIRFPTVRSPRFHDSAQYDEFRAVFIARIHVHSQVHRQETQHLACILTDRLVQYICRNINGALGKWSLHARWNFFSTIIEFSWPLWQRWPTWRHLRNGKDGSCKSTSEARTKPAVNRFFFPKARPHTSSCSDLRQQADRHFRFPRCHRQSHEKRRNHSEAERMWRVGRPSSVHEHKENSTQGPSVLH